MKKIFSIKKISLIVLMALCMFFATKNVEAAEKYVCYYYNSNYESPVYIQLKYENGVANFSYYNYATNQEVSEYIPGNGDWRVYRIEASSGQYITASDFANGCPPEIHEIDNQTNDDPNYTYDIYKGQQLEQWKERVKDVVCGDNYCGHLIRHYYFEGHTIEQGGDGKDLGNKICSYSHDNIQPAANHVTLKYNKNTNYIELTMSASMGPGTPKMNFTINDLGDECPKNIYSKGVNNENFYLTKQSGNNSYSFSLLVTASFEPEIKEMTACERLGGLTKYLTMIFNVLRYIVPLIIVVFSIIDFTGVVLSGEDEKMGKAKKKFAMRLVIGILVLFIPFLLELVFKLAGIINSKETLAYVVCNLF